MRVARKCAGNVLYREKTQHALLSPERLRRLRQRGQVAAPQGAITRVDHIAMRFLNGGEGLRDQTAARSAAG